MGIRKGILEESNKILGWILEETHKKSHIDTFIEILQRIPSGIPPETSSVALDFFNFIYVYFILIDYSTPTPWDSFWNFLKHFVWNPSKISLANLSEDPSEIYQGVSFGILLIFHLLFLVELLLFFFLI